MKNLFGIIASLFFVLSAYGQYFTTAYTTTANTPLTVSTNNLIIDTITVNASTANLTTAKFYDSASGTNIVTPAYTARIGYPTNVVQVFTNESAIIITNTFKGWWSGTTSVAAATNELPVITTFIVPGSGSLSRNVRLSTIQGLTLLTDQNSVVTLQYRLAQ